MKGGLSFPRVPGSKAIISGNSIDVFGNYPFGDKKCLDKILAFNKANGSEAIKVFPNRFSIRFDFIDIIHIVHLNVESVDLYNQTILPTPGCKEVAIISEIINASKDLPVTYNGRKPELFEKEGVYKVDTTKCGYPLLDSEDQREPHIVIYPMRESSSPNILDYLNIVD